MEERIKRTKQDKHLTARGESEIKEEKKETGMEEKERQGKDGMKQHPTYSRKNKQQKKSQRKWRT